jgi:nicotinamide mononucleotide transporter
LLVLCAVGGAVVTCGWAAAMRATTDAVAPLPDSAVLVFSVLAQFLLMERRLETWPVWLVVNTISVPLYLSQGLVGTAALYVAFWMNAAYGWRVWRRLAQTAPRHGDTPQQIHR